MLLSLYCLTHELLSTLFSVELSMIWLSILVGSLVELQLFRSYIAFLKQIILLSLHVEFEGMVLLSLLVFF